MKTTPNISRRSFLGLQGLALMAALAGCSTADDEVQPEVVGVRSLDDIHASGLGGDAAASSDTLEVKVRQKFPLGISVKALCDWVGIISPSLDRGYMLLGGENEIENHYSLYLDDKGY